MTTYYVAPPPLGSDSANGTTLATPWATWVHAETIATNSGDVVIGFPGTYREMPTQNVNGGTPYITGTVSLTNGSAVVSGSGTLWATNAFGGGRNGGGSVFRVTQLIGGTDGSTNGTDGTLSSAAGNFQSSLITQFASGSDGVTDGVDGVMTSASANFTSALVGYFINIGSLGTFRVSVVNSATSLTVVNPDGTAAVLGAGSGQSYSIWFGHYIRIGGLGTYVIAAVASATSMTVVNTNGSAATLTAGSSRTYSVGPETPYDVLTVNSNTQLTLTEPWRGPTLTGVSYLVYRPIRWIGDPMGTLTGATPGPVRITATDDDKTSPRAQSINNHGKGQRCYYNFHFDGGVTANIAFASGSPNITFEGCYFGYTSGGVEKIAIYDNGMKNVTVRNCYFTQGYNQKGVHAYTNTPQDDVCVLVENCIFECGCDATYAVWLAYAGDCLVRNNTIIGAHFAVSARFQNAGHACICYGNILIGVYCGFDAAAGLLFESWNFVSGPFSAGLFSSGVSQGPQTQVWMSLRDSRWYFNMLLGGAGPSASTQLITPYDLASYASVLNRPGWNPTYKDLRGTAAITSRDPGALEYDSTLKTKAGGAGGGLLLNPGMDGGMR